MPPCTGLGIGLCTALNRLLNRPVFRALCRCAGGSYPSHPTSPVHRPHGSEAHSANEPPQAGIGRALVSACCARRKESPNPSYSGWSARAQELRARDSRHRAASAGLFASAGESASRGTLRAVRMGCACSARLQRLPATWNSAALVARACRTICTSCDPIEVTADTDVTGCHGPAHRWLLGSWQPSHSLCKVRLHRLDHARPFVCDRSPPE